MRVDLRTLWEFVAGYLAILAIPGPNLLAVGGVAALRGLRGALPLCLGVATGAGVLGAALLAAATAAPGGEWGGAGRLLGAALLVWLAVSVARMPPPRAGAPARLARGADGLAAFGAGFLTAFTNPLTAAFFAAQFLGPLGVHEATAAVAPLATACAALLFFVCVAALLARPAIRAAAVAWHRPIRLSAAAMLLLLALSAAGTVLP